MKKIVCTLLALLFFPISWFAAKSLSVSAIIGAINYAPQIIIISPAALDVPWAYENVQNWTSIAIDFWITDAESNNVYFTITPSAWVVSNDNWGPVATTAIISTTHKEQFHYLAPTWVYWVQTITLTANDWISVSTKELNIYIY